MVKEESGFLRSRSSVKFNFLSFKLKSQVQVSSSIEKSESRALRIVRGQCSNWKMAGGFPSGLGRSLSLAGFQ